MPLSVRSKATSVVVSAPSKLFEFAQILSSYIRRLISIHWFSTSMKSKDCVSKRAVRLDGPSRRGTPASTAVQPHTPAIRYGITTGLGIEHHGTTRCYYPYTLTRGVAPPVLYPGCMSPRLNSLALPDAHYRDLSACAASKPLSHYYDRGSDPRSVLWIVFMFSRCIPHVVPGNVT